MSLSELFKKIASRLVIGNCLGMVLLSLLLGVGAWFFIGAYTRHGEVVSVPDVCGLDISTRNKAIAALNAAVMTYAKSGDFAKCLSGENKTVTLKNDVLKIGVSTKGGAITSATLLDYDTYRGKGVKLFDAQTNQFGFVFNTDAQRFNTADYYFTPLAQTDSTVTMQLNLGNDVTWAVRYTLEKGSYMVKMERHFFFSRKRQLS